MIARVMKGLVLSIVFSCVVRGSLTLSVVQTAEDYDVQTVTTNGRKPDLELDVNASYVDASLDNFGVDERLKRESMPEQVIPVGHHNLLLNHTEVYSKSPGDRIYWKDNAETQRLRHGGMITRVIHHGIYPSLNVTEPIGRTNWTSRLVKSRAKRGWFGGNAGSATTSFDHKYDSSGSINGTFHRETSFQVKDGDRTVHDSRNSQNRRTYTAFQTHYPPDNGNQPRYQATRHPTPSRVTKFGRAKRNSGFGSSRYYESVGTSPRTDTVYSRWDSQNVTVKTTYQAHYPPYNSSNSHNPNFDFTRNFSYARANHPVNGSRDYRFYTQQVLPPIRNITNSTKTYRILYYPASNSVDISQPTKGERNNKGNVRLISVGYYNVNESHDGVRSYHNIPGRGRAGYWESPTTNRFEPSRYRRDTSGSWSWLDRLFSSMGLAKFKNERNEIQEGSEAVKSEVSDGGNEVLQTHYGYSSNGHHHVLPTQMDRIHLVGGTSPTSAVPTTVAAASYEDISVISDEPLGLLAELNQKPETNMEPFLPTPSPLLPRSEDVLIQAPVRMISCKPPKRLARGRCRTVW